MTPLPVIAGLVLAADPAGLGGIILRQADALVFEAWLDGFRTCLAQGTPVRPLPVHIAMDRLIGGLDLPATLAAGKPILQRGLLAECDGGVAVIAGAERLDADRAGVIAAAMDSGEVAVAREGLCLSMPARFGIIARDEGLDDEAPPAVLAERIGLWLDLGSVMPGEVSEGWEAQRAALARDTFSGVKLPSSLLQNLCRSALSLGIGSLRAALFAAKAARIHAALNGRMTATSEDIEVAASLVYAGRLKHLPLAEEHQAPQPASSPESAEGETQSPQDEGEISERIVDAVKAALPPRLLETFTDGAGERPAARFGAAARGRQRKMKRGRPTGVRPSDGRGGERINLVATLRAAAPWQPLRRKSSGAQPRIPRILVTREDFRITRFRHRTETTAIFAVDASGSAAFHRLAEAKGAVELLLARCYIRRDRVALVSFRGMAADILLPPTRSLQRARRNLAALPGGGGTPLSHGIDAALSLADGVRRGGGDPLLVFLTDGKANIARDGTAGRAAAQKDALASARAVKMSGVKALLIDVSPTPAIEAQQLASEMGASYIVLPHADARLISASVSGAMS
jgi:magnesium chelatase subunit D